MPKTDRFKIFVVEDDKFYSELIKYHLSLNPDNDVVVFNDAKSCLDNLYKNPHLITVDFSLPDMRGDELLTKLLKQVPDLPVIVISSQKDIATAISLFKQGAYDYLVKDNDTKERLWYCVERAKENLYLHSEIDSLKEEISQKYSFQKNIIGNGKEIKKTFSLIEKAILSNINVSLAGETGTGKEVVSKVIHYNSLRSKKPFVAVNLAAIPNELIESELFGHEKGAFTGANQVRKGKFEEADGGTIFLDEVGEMKLSMQTKLLRVLQEREITRVGSNQTIKIDVRIISATNRNLYEDVKNGLFREDLYYRIIGLPIVLPPLRDRGVDIILLANHFIKLFCKENKFKSFTLSTKAREKLFLYSFPGNVRELKALIDLACVLSDNDKIEDYHLKINGGVEETVADISNELTLDEYTLNIVEAYLKKYNNNVLVVAKKLKVGKSTIYRMIKEKPNLT